MATFDDFIQLSDKDVTSLCERCRNPGGSEGGGRNTHRDRGEKIGFIQEKNLRQARFYIYHCHRIQRAFDPAATTLESIRSLWTNRFEFEEAGIKADSKDDELKPFKKDCDIRKALEDLDNLLGKKLGAGGSPLAYITRPEVRLPEAVDGEVDPGMNLPSVKEELVRRTRHDGPHFEADNEAVFSIIRDFTHKGPAWNWVSSHQRTRDGRAAYLDLVGHYLGASFVNKTISDATADLETIRWTGRSRNFTWDDFSGKLNKAFSDLADNGQVYTDKMKVHQLLKAIEDPVLGIAKLRVLSEEKFQENYNEAVSFFAMALNQYTNADKQTRNISGLFSNDHRGGRGPRGGGRGGGGRGGGGRGGRSGRGGRGRDRSNDRSNNESDHFDPKDPARTLSNKGWKEATPEQREQIKEARKNKKRKASAVETDRQDEKEEGKEYDHFRPGDQITRKKKGGKV